MSTDDLQDGRPRLAWGQVQSEAKESCGRAALPSQLLTPIVLTRGPVLGADQCSTGLNRPGNFLAPALFWGGEGKKNNAFRIPIAHPSCLGCYLDEVGNGLVRREL